MMTLLLFVYRKFFPFGSPPNTIGVPRVVLGKEAKTLSEIKIKLMTKKKHYKTIHTTVKPCFIPPDSSPNSHIAMKLSCPVFFPCNKPRYNDKLAYRNPPRCQRSNGQFTVDCPSI